MAKINKTVKALMELLGVSEEIAKAMLAFAEVIKAETAGSSDDDEEESDDEDEDEDEDSDDEESDDEDEDEDESDDEDEDEDESDDEDEDEDEDESDDEDEDEDEDESDDDEEESDDEESDDEEESDDDEEEAEGYAALNFKQLKKQAKDRGIDVVKTIGKAKSEDAQSKKLIGALEELDAAVDALHKKKLSVLEKLATKNKIKWSKPRGRASEDKIKAAIVEALVANGIFG